MAINPYLLGLLTAAVFVILVWLIGIVLDKYDIVDGFWGLGFITIGVVSALTYGTTPVSRLILILVLIWGIRLSIYLLYRTFKHKGEDPRYARIREGGGIVPLKMFFQLYIFQIIVMFANAILVINVIYQQDPQPLGFWQYLGVAFFAVGLFFEAVGDWQLMIFKSNPSNLDKVLDTGLWRYSRHPNYFGEAVMWWAMFVATIGTELFYIGIISPVIITLFVRYVSGVPMVEKAKLDNADYQAYIKKTSVFLPRPPKS